MLEFRIAIYSNSAQLFEEFSNCSFERRYWACLNYNGIFAYQYSKSTTDFFCFHTIMHDLPQSRLNRAKVLLRIKL